MTYFLVMEISAHEKWFADYAAQKIAACGSDAEPLTIKREHTARVLANARAIAFGEGFAPQIRRAVELGALYHDLSRFDQYLVYGTFKDRDSRNHGSWSVKLLRTLDRLAGESRQTARLVRVAIGMHNRLALPSGLSEVERLVCNAVRDADKLDIVRVMEAHLQKRPYNPTVVLGLPDTSLAGPAVMAAAWAGKPASYSDLRSVNDFRLLLGTWLFGLNFESSRRLFIGAHHAAKLVADLPQNEVYGAIRDRLLNLLQAV